MNAWLESVATLHTILGLPFSILLGVAGLLGLGRRGVDARVERSLDELLAREGETLKRRRRADPLDFATTAHVHAGRVGVGWGWLAGRVRIVRTVRAPVDGGYRLRLRAFARGGRGRVLVRHLDVDVR
jgi:hypothetical protein